MATLREIKRRITSVKSTAKITQAMKMVAAAKLRRAQDAMHAARPYTRTLDKLLKDLLASVEETTARAPLLFGRTESETNSARVLLIVVGSDRGLAGAFNSGLIKFAESRVRETYSQHHASGRLAFITVGRRTTDYFTKRDYKVVNRYVGIFTKLDFSTAKSIADEAT